MSRIHLIVLIHLTIAFNVWAQYDTLVIHYISIEPKIAPNNDVVQIHFTPYNDPDLFQYEVKYFTHDGLGNLSTVPNPLPLVNNQSSPITFEQSEVDQSPQCYQVQAQKASGEILALNYHYNFLDSTMYLEASQYERCNYSLPLKWNDYNRWRGNIDHYRITAISTSTSEPYYSPPIPEGQRNMEYNFHHLPPNDTYMVYVTAFNARYDSVNSNGIEVTISNTLPPEYIYAEYVTVNSSNQPELSFLIDPESEVRDYILSRSTSVNAPFESIYEPSTSADVVTYTDTEVDASLQPYFYLLEAINNCDSLAGSSQDSVGTIFVTATTTGQMPQLSWTPYHGWPEGVAEYQVERSLNKEPFEIIGSSNSSSYPDSELPNLAGNDIYHSIQYRVIAIRNPDSDYTDEPAQSRSNSASITIPLNIEFYDAFIPGHADYDGFEPQFDFLPAYYDFKIFNRSGSVVYHSKDAENTRWDGKLRGGTYAPQGVYRYTLIYHDEHKNRQVLKGSLTVVRQD